MELPCLTCDHTFKRKRDWQRHDDTHSQEKKKQKVGPDKDTNGGECGIKYPSRTLHMEKYHPMELKCSTCGMTFKRRRDLQRHNDTHSQEKRLKCTNCTNSAFRPQTLSHHKKLHHPIKETEESPEEDKRKRCIKQKKELYSSERKRRKEKQNRLSTQLSILVVPL